VGRHYLFPMWEGGGNVPPILGVARRLIERGHRVTVLGDPTIQVEAEQFGCRFLPWRRAPHRTTLLPEDDLLRDWETKNPFQMLSHYRDRFITDPAPAYAADTLDAIDATSPDLIVPEYTIFGAFIAAEKRGCRPSAWFRTSGPCPLSERRRLDRGSFQRGRCWDAGMTEWRVVPRCRTSPGRRLG